MLGSIIAHKDKSFPDRLIIYVRCLHLIIILPVLRLILVLHNRVLIGDFLLSDNGDLFREWRIVWIDSLRPGHEYEPIMIL